MSAQGGQAGWTLVSGHEMSALDRHTIHDLGVPGEVLMESAGRAITEVVLELLARLAAEAPEVLVLCGSGNNGGDGFVCARLLSAEGEAVRVALVGDVESLQGDARANYQRALASGVRVDARAPKLPESGVVVDALFGTGLSRPLRGAHLREVRRLNRARKARRSLRVLSVDLPSGLDADTGQVLGDAVAADQTVTIGLPKLGLAQEPGRSLAGEIRVARIGIADRAPGATPSASLWTPAAAARQLPVRTRAGHKGSFGHVLVIAGSAGKTGAAALASDAAVRGGAGLVTLACPASLADVLEVKCTEAMTVAVPDSAERSFASSSEDALLRLAHERDVVALGPGIGRADETRKLVRALAPSLRAPLVLDADGLVAFEAEPERLAKRKEATVLTPHPGEAGLLLGQAAVDINRDRVAAARVLAKRSGATVLLKGAGTVIAEPEGRIAINPTGSPLLASGGSGDVLTGLLAALLAQGLPAFEAATAAAYLHGAAADWLGHQLGSAGLAASDLSLELPRSAARLRRIASDPASSLQRQEDQGRGLLLPFPGA